MTSRRPPPALIGAAALLAAVLVASAFAARNTTTWALEVFPVALVLPFLAWTWRRHPLTPLLYGAVFVHALILIGGGITSYAEQPIGFWLQDLLGLQRNPYDRIGHLAQGFVPALAAREILLRGRHLPRGRMLGFLVVCVVLAISASYELVEWAAALALGQGADEFLGTQGDEWDTQADMLMALIGALAALLLAGRWHDRQIARSPAWPMPSERDHALSKP